MRVLYVGRNARIGGGTTFRLNSGRGLIRRGHEVWVASLGGEVVPRFREAGIGFVWTPPPPFGGRWIEAAIRQHGIDLVHASNTTPGRAAAWACARTGVPLVISIHGILGRDDHLKPCLTAARRILSFEEVAIERLARRGSIDMARVVLLRRPIEPRPRLPAETGPFRVVAVSRLSRRKGRSVLALVDGFAAFRRLVPESRLDILGDGTLLGPVRRAAAEVNRAAGRAVVAVHGSRPDPLPITREAHVLVGASYCALEAIMQGVAVIGAGFWGYGVVHADNLRDAMAWNFGDVGGEWEMTAASFETALSDLYRSWTSETDRERYWCLHRLIEGEHSLDRVAERLEALYSEVLVEAPGPVRLAPAPVVEDVAA